jgi:cytochrome c oxidase subunit 4
MSTHASDATHRGASNALITTVWLILLVLTLVEVFLAYERVPVNIMLTVLMGLSIIKAALIMAYFMHLRFERLGLFLTLVPAMVFCICMMMVVFFPDSLHLLYFRTH